jgi:ribosomal subunit interface protein
MPNCWSYDTRTLCCACNKHHANGRNVEVPEHYWVHVAEKMAHIHRYDDKIIYYVELFHEHNRRQSKPCQQVEIRGTGNGPVVRTQARGPDFYTALAAALAKLMTRLRRSHDRRQVHHGHRTATSVDETTGSLGSLSTAPGTKNDDRPQRQRESGDVEDPGYIVRERNRMSDLLRFSNVSERTASLSRRRPLRHRQTPRTIRRKYLTRSHLDIDLHPGLDRCHLDN